MTEDERRRGIIRLLTHPHIQVSDIYVRLTLQMFDGRWVVAISSNRPPATLEALGLLSHLYFEAASHWMDVANARLAKQRATAALDRVMGL